MTEKPSYLGLLNAIAVAEGRAHTYLTEWASRTEDEGVKDVLEFVALREGEHSLAFEKRVVELGFKLRPDDRIELAEQLDIVRSDRSDREKFEALRLGDGTEEPGPDIFSRMFENKDIDPVTGGLLGRYVAEEREQRQAPAGLLRRPRGEREAQAGDEAPGEGGHRRREAPRPGQPRRRRSRLTAAAAAATAAITTNV